MKTVSEVVHIATEELVLAWYTDNYSKSLKEPGTLCGCVTVADFFYRTVGLSVGHVAVVVSPVSVSYILEKQDGTDNWTDLLTELIEPPTCPACILLSHMHKHLVPRFTEEQVCKLMGVMLE